MENKGKSAQDYFIFTGMVLAKQGIQRFDDEFQDGDRDEKSHESSSH